jgi:hypothetical protein
MHALLTRTLAAAAVLAVVPPLAAAPASARPEPGPSPTVTSWERPDGYDPGWDTYRYRSPAFGPNGVLRGELRRLELARDRTANQPGGSVYQSQVPRAAWDQELPADDLRPLDVARDRTANQPGGSVYQSQVPRAAWER